LAFAHHSPLQSHHNACSHFAECHPIIAIVCTGLALGIIATGARRVPDHLFFIAAKTLATQVTEADIAQGTLYPPMGSARRCSALIAAAVGHEVYEKGLATHMPRPGDMLQFMVCISLSLSLSLSLHLLDDISVIAADSMHRLIQCTTLIILTLFTPLYNIVIIHTTSFTLLFIILAVYIASI
jgi:hypothetical protein